ncbi:MAG: hypothetical protein K9J16_12990 [Melioribacteraceae bacterium]|nr:hypothetical protein [Melioribacteraceae bacterium]MCF8353665.1 hypothetical protein [Melioribacteraceae bacterium]MCF8393435.1 hypothetical protein [Melioribacteraceae bacterium]MCF8419292.1 hypothetical protein [Melioribacteraceae bacterium]
MKQVVIALMSVFLLGSCGTIQKYAKQGMDAAEKAAENYVDKETGSGTFDDTMKMKGDTDKTQHLLPFYATVNKMCDDKKIDEKKRDELKAQFDSYYAEWKDGKITEAEYKKNCEDAIDNAENTDTAK